ncbi:MAG: hypothetical protein ACI87E_000475 [Mariniblastus sp.]|jgi:hypothetical protein
MDLPNQTGRILKKMAPNGIFWEPRLVLPSVRNLIDGPESQKVPIGEYERPVSRRYAGSFVRGMSAVHLLIEWAGSIAVGLGKRLVILCINDTKKGEAECFALIEFTRSEKRGLMGERLLPIYFLASPSAMPLISTAYKRVRSDRYIRPLAKVGVL